MKCPLATVWVLLLFVLAGCASQRRDMGEHERQAIVSTTEVFVRASSVPNLQVSVTIEAVEGNYARVHVEPTRKGAADIATVYLKKQPEWTGVAMGTFFNEEDPKGLVEQGFPRQLLR